MSPAQSGSLALSHVELADALEIRDALIFDFYPGLPHVIFSNLIDACLILEKYKVVYTVNKVACHFYNFLYETKSTTFCQ